MRHEDLEAAIEAEGDRLAVVLLAGVSYATGQRLDIERLTRAAHGVGAVAVWDLAHAVGNVPLALHDWDVDAAAWCTYKYLNGGPGAPGQLFVHERHATDAAVPRLEGWWGNAEDTRFRMDVAIDPAPGADAWRVSTVPVLGAAAVAAGLELFEDVGLPALRARSLALTGFLEALVDRFVPSASILTPRDPAQRGCQLSLRFPDARTPVGDARGTRHRRRLPGARHRSPGARAGLHQLPRLLDGRGGARRLTSAPPAGRERLERLERARDRRARPSMPPCRGPGRAGSA